jgi:competence protein ComEA
MKLNRVVSAALAFAMAFVLSTGMAVAAEAAPAGKVNINTASAAQLSALPGIGEKLAARIVDHRSKSGSFKSVQELMNVKGIGERNLAKLEQHLTVGEAKGTAR